MECFLEKLERRQLKGFVWRSSYKMSVKILGILASNHGSTLNCLYIDALAPLKAMRHQDTTTQFTSMKTLRWQGGKNPDGLFCRTELHAISQLIEASASTLQTISLEVKRTTGWSDVFRPQSLTERFEIKLPALVEYQTPLRLHAQTFNAVPLGSQIQRLYITELDIGGSTAATLLFSVKDLIELHYTYLDAFSDVTAQAIFRHGKTLERLYICADISGFQPLVLSARAIQDIGRRCPNLIELGITRRTDHPNTASCTMADDCSCLPSMTEFPLHALANLEVLFISIQLKRSTTTVDADYFLDYSVVKAMKRKLENMLNRELDSNNNTPVTRSSKLRIIAMGAGTPELHHYPRTQARPRIWKVNHHGPTGKLPITLSTTTFEESIDGISYNWPPGQRSQRDWGHNWKLLRRYPLLVPNEGMHHIFHPAHLPPASKLPTPSEYAIERKQPDWNGFFI
ncbi:hypothetical protein TWF718_000137 [Orbilia javanica]